MDLGCTVSRVTSMYYEYDDTTCTIPLELHRETIYATLSESRLSCSLVLPIIVAQWFQTTFGVSIGRLKSLHPLYRFQPRCLVDIDQRHPPPFRNQTEPPSNLRLP